MASTGQVVQQPLLAEETNGDTNGDANVNINANNDANADANDPDDTNQHSSNKRPRMSGEEGDNDARKRQLITAQSNMVDQQQQQPPLQQQQQQQHKQQKREQELLPNQNHGFCLVEDVFSIVMSMLAPREMLCLSRCSKSLMNMVTHENVVRNTIMIGGHPRKSLRALMDLLHDRKIFFPSAMRLLRVSCGQHCEIEGCNKTVHTIRSHYGIFCCFK